VNVVRSESSIQLPSGSRTKPKRTSSPRSTSSAPIATPSARGDERGPRVDDLEREIAITRAAPVRAVRDARTGFDEQTRRARGIDPRRETGEADHFAIEVIVRVRVRRAHDEAVGRHAALAARYERHAIAVGIDEGLRDCDVGGDDQFPITRRRQCRQGLACVVELQDRLAEMMAMLADAAAEPAHVVEGEAEPLLPEGELGFERIREQADVEAAARELHGMSPE
jgi:hypothetical protein